MRQPPVIHPFLGAIFPVIFLYSHNLDQVWIGETVAPILIFASLAFVFWILLRLFFNNSIKAGLIVTLLIFLNFSYGHIIGMMAGMKLLGVEMAKHRYLIPAVVMIFAIVFFLIWRTRRNLQKLTAALNAAAVILVAVPVTIAIYGIASEDHGGVESRINMGMPQKSIECPDIYYIILDGYARADILKDLYHYDNGEFLNYLMQKGFYIADRSRANYGQTYLSLASSLNLVYLDDIAKRLGLKSSSDSRLIQMIKENEVVNFLKNSGYLIVAFSSGYSGTEMRDADFYYKPSLWSLSEFQRVLVGGTLVEVLPERILVRTSFSYTLHRKRILYVLDNLSNVTEMNRPVFVFAHILAPHPPFVFGEHGEPVEPGRSFSLNDGSDFMKQGNKDEYIMNYKRQLTFINNRLKKTIDDILSRSPEPPIIIIQSDHGPGSMLDWEEPMNTDFDERMSILNAFYLPFDGHLELYEEITPVNSFRVILDYYFGTDLELLDDKSYFSSTYHPYEFIDVTPNVNVD
jgi:hypothetical protein